jgi:hypothetical protein
LGTKPLMTRLAQLATRAASSLPGPSVWASAAVAAAALSVLFSSCGPSRETVILQLPPTAPAKDPALVAADPLSWVVVGDGIQAVSLSAGSPFSHPRSFCSGPAGALSASGFSIYVACGSPPALIEIDPSAMVIRHSFALPAAPLELTTDRTSATVFVLLRDGEVLAGPLKPSPALHLVARLPGAASIAYLPTISSLCVVEASSVVIDPLTSSQAARTVRLPATPVACFTDPFYPLLAVAATASPARLYLIDGAGQVVASRDLRVVPSYLAADPALKRLYVLDSKRSDLYYMTSLTGRLQPIVTIPCASAMTYVTVEGSYLVFGCQATRTVYVFRASDGYVHAVFGLDGPPSAMALALS